MTLMVRGLMAQARTRCAGSLEFRWRETPRLFIGVDSDRFLELRRQSVSLISDQLRDLPHGVAVFRGNEWSLYRQPDGIGQVVFDRKHRAGFFKDWISFGNEVDRRTIHLFGLFTQNEEVAIAPGCAGVVTKISVRRFNRHPTFINGAKQNLGDMEINPDDVVAMGQTAVAAGHSICTDVEETVRSFERFRDGDSNRQFCFSECSSSAKSR